jgi:uncharacterized SAM-binding protein YcdF (DUF218 family)
MEYWFKALFKAFFMPPGVFLALMLIGLSLLSRSKLEASGSFKAGLRLALIGSLGLYCFSTGHVASMLGSFIEREVIPLATLESRLEAFKQGQAIVILAGGVRRNALENESTFAPSTRSLERVNYGVRLARESALPILVSGGVLPAVPVSEAHVMASAIETDYGLKVRWVEDKSIDTIENAQNSAKMLASNQIKSIVLVTHASHMPRARSAFERQGLVVISAPTCFTQKVSIFWMGWLPNASSLATSFEHLHEILGLWWLRFHETEVFKRSF